MVGAAVWVVVVVEGLQEAVVGAADWVVVVVGGPQEAVVVQLVYEDIV